MNIGIIGTGRHGSRYAHHIVDDFNDLQLSAIARRSDEGAEQASVWGARHYRDYRELIESDQVDAIIAAVPPVHRPGRTPESREVPSRHEGSRCDIELSQSISPCPAHRRGPRARAAASQWGWGAVVARHRRPVSRTGQGVSGRAPGLGS